MSLIRPAALFCALLLIVASVHAADRFTDTAELFRQAGESGKFFERSYGYAVFLDPDTYKPKNVTGASAASFE